MNTGLWIGAVTIGLLGCGACSSLDVKANGREADDDSPPASPLICPPSAPGLVSWSTVVEASFCSASHVAVRSDATGNAFLAIAQSNQMLGGDGVRVERDRFPVDLAKVDADGRKRFNVSVGGAPDSGTGALSIDRNGNADLLTPQPLTSSGQPVLSHLSSGGRLEVTRSITKNADGSWYPLALRTDASFASLVLGSAHGAVDLGGGLLPAQPGEFFVAKLDRSGAHIWSRVFGGPVRDADFDVETTGSMAIAGMLDGKVTFGDASFDSDGVAVFIAALEADGSPIFSHVLRSTNTPAVLGVARDADRNSYLALSFSDTLDLGPSLLSHAEPATALLKYDSGGALIWVKQLGEASPMALALSETGEPLLAGFAYGGVDLGNGALVGDGSFFVTKLGADGAPTWWTSLPGSLHFVPSIAAGVCGGVLVGGPFQGVFDTGRELLHSTIVGPVPCASPLLMLLSN